MVTDDDINESNNSSSQIFASKANLGDSSPESDTIL